jgi:hypothetical protein
MSNDTEKNLTETGSMKVIPEYWGAVPWLFSLPCLAAFGQPNPALVWASMDSDWEGLKQGVVERLKNASIVVSDLDLGNIRARH